MTLPATGTFLHLFQTARTLYFLWGGDRYSKRVAYSWRGDTSTRIRASGAKSKEWRCPPQVIGLHIKNQRQQLQSR